MSGFFFRFARGLLAVGVTAALLIGVSELRAGADDCPIDYGRGQVGYCASQEHCDVMCNDLYGMSGICQLDDCCQCMVR